MDKGRILLKLVMDEANIPLELDSFPKRFAIQKKLYLLQLTGLDLGYRYSWYLKGPYSTDLTRDAFLLQEEIDAQDKEFEEYKLTEEAKKKANFANQIWQNPHQTDINNNDWLELLASLHYLKHLAYWRGKKQPVFNDVFPRLITTKPHFSDKREWAELAWKQLEKLGLIENKTLS